MDVSFLTQHPHLKWLFFCFVFCNGHNAVKLVKDIFFLWGLQSFSFFRHNIFVLTSLTHHKIDNISDHLLPIIFMLAFQIQSIFKHVAEILRFAADVLKQDQSSWRTMDLVILDFISKRKIISNDQRSKDIFVFVTNFLLLSVYRRLD